MRIQNITSYSATFGYNRAVNKQLVKQLDNENGDLKQLADELKSLNNVCNNTEQYLRSCVKKDDPIQDTVYDLFLNLKTGFLNTVESIYPELDITRKEMNTYYHEAEDIILKSENSNPAIPWQHDIASYLDSMLAVTGSYLLEDPLQTDNTVDNRENTEGIDANEAQSKPEIAEKNALLEVPSVIEKFVPTFSSPKGFVSIGGMAELKDELYDKIINPALNPEQAELDFKEYGKRAPRGIIFYGPPGCGKTMNAEATAVEAGMPLFKLKISKAGSKYINQTSKNYQEAFDYVAAYSENVDKPCIMLIDEIDGITKGRESSSSGEDLKQMGTLLNLIETARDKNIIVIGTTNKYDLVDEAIRRRFDEQIYIGMPDIQTRKEILEKTLSQWMKGANLAKNPDDINEIATKLDSFPSSAVVILADKASDRARKDGRREIVKDDFFKEIADNQNLKIKENNYKPNVKRKSIGFAE